MQYSLACPACEHTLTVDAQNDEGAIEKFMEEGKIHLIQAHPEMAATPEEGLRNMVRTNMRKGGSESPGGGETPTGGPSQGPTNPSSVPETPPEGTNGQSS